MGDFRSSTKSKHKTILLSAKIITHLPLHTSILISDLLNINNFNAIYGNMEADKAVNNI